MKILSLRGKKIEELFRKYLPIFFKSRILLYGGDKMAFNDKYYHQAKNALEKDGWNITNDPLEVEYGMNWIEIDLGAEKEILIGAEKMDSK